MPEFEIGKIYNRRSDIHEIYGGQRQGGASTPKSVAAVFIFTGSAGLKHGYEDRYQPDGLFWYYGEGQLGDMALVWGNMAIANHVEDEKELHLFEFVGIGPMLDSKKPTPSYLDERLLLTYFEKPICSVRHAIDTDISRMRID